MGSDTEMVEAPTQPEERKQKERTGKSSKSSKHRSKDKDRSLKDQISSPGANDKEVSDSKHRRKHRSSESRQEKGGDGEKSRRKACDISKERSPRRRERPRSPRTDAEPGELAVDTKHGRDAAADAAEFIRLEEKNCKADVSHLPQSLVPHPPIRASPDIRDSTTDPAGLPPLAGDVQAGYDERREHASPHVKDSGGEVSMSVDETNKMRVAMGLKPLTATSSTTNREAKEAAAGKARVEEREAKVVAVSARERISRARDKRLMEEGLRKVKTLGSSDPDADDISLWVSKSREVEAETRRAAERAAAAKLSTMYDEEDDVSDDDGNNGDAAAAAHMAGMRVRHSANELEAGETVILTLADRNILDDAGGLNEDDAPEELEDVQSAQDRQRAKARAAAKKPAVEYDVDGNAKGMLSKYDEEEADAGMEIGGEGVILDAKARHQAELRRKLTEDTDTLQSGAGPAAMGGAAEYYTKDEMAAFTKPKRGVKKKLRKKAKRGDDEDTAVPSTTSEAIAVMEAATLAEATANGGSSGRAAGDHGSRRSRGAAREADVAARAAADAAAKRDRYDAALKKANYATLAATMEPSGGGDDEEDEVQAALEESMRRNRAQAARRPVGAVDGEDEDGDAVLAAVADRRRAEEAAPSSADAPSGGDGHRLTEAAEFARLVGHRDEDKSTGGASSAMETDAPPPPPPLPGSPAATASNRGDAGGAAAMDFDASEGAPPLPPPPRSASRSARVKKEEPEEEALPQQSITRERNVGIGMGAALELMRQRGELGRDLKAVEWAGRSNDMKPVALQGLESVYTGGRSEDAVANSVERALTRRDMYGRVQTPKQAFRELCHNFHGIFPSKDRQERQMMKDAEAAAAKKSATSEQPDSLRRLHAAQKIAAAPYVVLNGSVRPGQISDPTSGFATANGYETQRGGAASLAPTPLLGGGKTPLVGNRKVQTMLGMKRSGGDVSMPPPPPRKPKQEP